MKKLIPVLVILLAASITFAQMQQGKDGKMGGKGRMGGKCAMMQGKMGGPGCGCMGMMMFDDGRMAKRLGLSDQDKAGIKEITDKLKADMQGIHDQMRDAHKALHDEYVKKDLDNGAIDGLNRKILGLHNSHMELMLNARKAIMNKLAPEQRAKLGPPQGDANPNVGTPLQRRRRAR